MSIYCTYCGKDLPNDANFCLKCGKALSGATQAEPRWEYCEIVTEELKHHGLIADGIIRFWARAIGREGTYSAGDSASIKHPASYADGTRRDHIAALNNLIEELVENGWEAIPEQGRYWYSNKFRRRVTE